MLTTKQIREMIRDWPDSRLATHIHGARETMPTGRLTTCARHIAIFRAELARRAARDAAPQLSDEAVASLRT